MNLEELKVKAVENKQITTVELELIEIVSTLKNYRKAKKITQIEMAKRTGMTQTQYSKFENFYNTPNLETIVRVMDALGLSLKEILKGNINSEEACNIY